MKFCIVGTNFISDRFCEALSELSMKAYAVYSRSNENGAAFAMRHGIEKVYTDFDKMLLDESIDALYIASPNFCHAEQSVAALLRGKHVLCEKPLASEFDGYLKMKRAMKKSGGWLIEAMRPAFDPATEVIERSLPLLGKIRRASFEFCQYSSRYDSFKMGEIPNAFNPKMKNSALADIGIYPLYTALRLLGEPKKISKDAVYLENGFEAAGILTLLYPDMVASVTYSKITDSVNPSVIEGECGSLTIDKMNSPREAILHLRGESPRRLEIPYAKNNMIYEIDAFIKICKGELDASASVSLSEKLMRAYESVR